MKAIWHDLECGPYVADLPVWRALADQAGGAVLDIGAGTGRVSLDLARRGHRVTALDHDAELLAELERRAHGLEVRTALADARDFELDARFGLCVVPMQTVQLLGGSEGRGRFLHSVRRHLAPGGLLAAAITVGFELFEGPLLPDMCERDGVLYSSQPTAVRAENGRVVLERLRQTVLPDGRHRAEHDRIELDRLTVAELEREAAEASFSPAGTNAIEPTDDHVGSEVVMLRA